MPALHTPSPAQPPAPASKATLFVVALALATLLGCERLEELAGLPNPKKEAAAAEGEGRAIGSACRHSGRALEDCYLLNPTASKFSIFAGWKEMNDYMTQNNLEVVPSHLPASNLLLPRAKPEADKAPGDHGAQGDKASAKADPPPEDTEEPPKNRRRYRRSEGK